MPNRRNWTLVLSFSLFILLSGCGQPDRPASQAQAPAETEIRRAAAHLQSTQGNTAGGTVEFIEEVGKQFHVEISFTGLPPGKHGFHIHETGDCSAPDASSAGGHFNPDAKPHGAPTAAEHHLGDLGNVEAGAEGQIQDDLHVSFLTLEGPNSIRGKAVILHAGEDDFSQPSGNAGARIACGVIQ